MYKKAVSPLIATVLLLAFAVSIATIIVQLEPFEVSCASFEAKVNIDEFGEGICYNENDQTMEFILKNNKFFLEEIKVSVIANQVKNHNLDISIEPYSAEIIKIPYDKKRLGSPKELIITKFYQVQGKIEECIQTIKIQSFNDC